MKLRLIPTLLLCAFAAAACSREPDPAVQLPQDVREAVQNAPAAPAPPAARTVDVCALLAEADAVAVLGTLTNPPQAQAPQGSLLGGCDYAGAKGSGSVSARPADEFAGTVEYMGKRKPVRQLSALGEAAYATEYGVMVQPAGRSYFLSVFIVGDNGPALTEALARKLKL
jgi:hypothetical protein